MATPTKRARSPGEEEGVLVVAKKSKDDGALVVSDQKKPSGPKRTSTLAAPIMLLKGHADAVYSVRFSLDGEICASGGHDKNVLLWRVHGEECENFMMIQGHRNAVTDLRFTADGERIVTASSDKTARVWDAQTGTQLKKMAEHEGFMNTCDATRRGTDLALTGGDDGTAKVWDLRQRRSVATFQSQYAVMAVAFSDAGDMVCAAGLDGAVRVFDLRREELWMELLGHTEAVTGLAVSPDGSFLLSNSMDQSLRMWDMRPYAPANRCVKVFAGHTHSFEQNLLRCCWSADGSKVSAGSSDGLVNIWDVNTRRLLYKLPGHKGSVNDVAFHPKEPIVASCSSDHTIYLGEIST